MLKFLDRLLSYILIESIRDESLGDLWESHNYLVSQRKPMFIRNLVTLWRALLLVWASIQLAGEDRNKKNTHLVSSWASKPMCIIRSLYDHEMQELEPSEKIIPLQLEAYPKGSGQPTPIFPSRSPVCIFNKRPVIDQNFTQQSLQSSIDDLQSRLYDEGYLSKLSGKFDSETERAVRAFQEKNNLFVDGVVGPLTWACLCYPKLSIGIHKSASTRTKAAIKELQSILREEGLSVKDADGCFGKSTERAVKVFQRMYGLHPDGVVNAIAWAVLLGMRQETERGFLQGFYSLTPQSLFLFNQLLMIVFIVLGMYLNPISTAQPLPQFASAVATAYALTCVVPMILERFSLKSPKSLRLPLLRYAPYVLTGMLWHPIITVSQELIEKLL